MAGATVRAFNAGTGYERSVVSDDAGRYGMPLLPPGEYVVFVEAPAFATMSQTGVVLRAGQVLTVEFAMSTTAFAETVQVTAAQPAVEVGRTVQSNTYDERTVRAIPTDRPQHPRLLRAAARRQRAADLERRLGHRHAVARSTAGSGCGR